MSVANPEIGPLISNGDLDAVAVLLTATPALVRATNRSGVSRPLFTPRCHRTCRRSSTPPQPLGILVKSSSPSRFCALVKQQ